MKIFFLAVIIYFVYVLVRYIIGFISVVIHRKKAYILFREIDNLFKQRYTAMNEIFSEQKPNELIQLEGLNDDMCNIDRKLALNFLLENKISDLQTSNETYVKLTNQIAKLADTYNKNALKLKTDTEVYPMSIIARMMEVRSVDFLKTTYINE